MDRPPFRCWLTFKVRDEIHDLSALLRLTGDRGRTSIWRVSDVEAAGHPEPAAELDRISAAGEQIIGDRLLDIASQLPQVIEGEFGAFDVGSTTPWLVVEAIDSSWWDVGTDDAGMHAAVRGEFPGVEDTTALH